MSEDKIYDVLVVGAGFAGSTAALVAARKGLKVALLDRSEFMGSKIVMGSLIRTTILKELIPDFESKAPLERFIRAQRFICLTEDSSLSMEYDDQKYYEPPHNNLWSIKRGKFDPWYAQQAGDAGAELFLNAYVTDLITEGNAVKGVRTKHGEEYRGNIVIIATGGNSKLVRQMGDHPEYPPDSYILGIKEVRQLDPEILEKRFFLSGREGISANYYGYSVEGNVGSSYIVTNQDSISVGAVINAKSLKGAVRNAPLRFLSTFKAHPHVRRLLEGSRTTAMSTYIMPEIGFDYMRNLYCEGAMVVGDAAGFLNASLYPWGSLMAFVSGLYAGETAVEACSKKDYSKRMVSKYSNRIIESFIMNDMRRYNRTPYFTQNFPEFFSIFPKMAVDLVEDYLKNDDEFPGKRQKKIFRKVKQELTLFPFLREIIESKRKFGGY